METGSIFQWVNLGVTMVVGIYVWLTNRNRVTHARITELQERTSKTTADIQTEFRHDLHRIEGEIESRLDIYGAQLARLEEGLKHVPDMEELRAIHERINTVSEMVTQLKGESSGMNNLLRTIHEHLLKKG